MEQIAGIDFVRLRTNYVEFRWTKPHRVVKICLSGLSAAGTVIGRLESDSQADVFGSIGA